jgi:hypothetical protein
VPLDRRGGGVEIPRLAGDEGGGEPRTLPEVVMRSLRDRGPEPAPELLLERENLLALGLEAAALREVEVDLDQADEARRYSALSTDSVS